MVYGYARVSTRTQSNDGNSLEVQERQLTEKGIEELYIDVFTGAETDRPRFTELLNKLQSGDTLMVTKLDRIARSATQGNVLIADLINKGITVNILNLGVLDNTPTSRLIRTVLLAFAEFERDMIKERTIEGKAKAKLDPNFKDGRPLKFNDEKIRFAMDLLDKGVSYNKTAAMTGISKSTLLRNHNIIRDAKILAEREAQLKEVKEA